MKKKTLLITIILAVLAIGAYLYYYYATTVVEQSKIAYDSEDYDLAISNYTRANKLIFWDKEKKASNLLWRGRAYYYGKEDYNQALADFTEAIELHPDYYPYYTWRARTHYQMRNYNLAIADFSKSIELYEDADWDKYLERASAYFMNEDFALAIADYDRAISVLDENINSPYISTDRIDELKKKRNTVISNKKRTERAIKWRIDNPEESLAIWMLIDLFEHAEED